MVWLVLAALAAVAQGMLLERTSLLQRQTLTEDQDPPQFTDLQSCTDAYNSLKARYDALMAECHPEEEEPEEEEEEAPPEPQETEPVSVEAEEADGGESAADSPIAGDIGGTSETEASPNYKPPIGGSGAPDAAEGWDYADGGEDWSSKFGQCGATSQSPIDIPKYIDIGGQTMSVLWFDYFSGKRRKDTSPEIRNAGHGLYFESAKPMDLGGVKLMKTNYRVKYYIFHTPSEHTIAGEHLPLELQVYHESDEGKEAAVSILFREGEENKFIKDLLGNSEKMPVWSMSEYAESAPIKLEADEAFNLENALRYGSLTPGGDLAFYMYEGSNTAPPCEGGVQWWVSKEPNTASEEQIDKIKDAIYASASTKDGNARKTQPLAGRKIMVGHTGFQHHGAGFHRQGAKQWPPRAAGHSTFDHAFEPHKKGDDYKTHWGGEKEPAVKDGNWVPDPIPEGGWKDKKDEGEEEGGDDAEEAEDESM